MPPFPGNPLASRLRHLPTLTRKASTADTMTPASPFRAVYKTVEGQDIDVDVYLPDPAAGAPEARSPICMPA